MGECTEVGMYIAMARQADREGYPEIAEAFKDMLLKKLTMLQDLQNFLVKLLQIQLREILNYVQKPNSALATVR